MPNNRCHVCKKPMRDRDDTWECCLCGERYHDTCDVWFTHRNALGDILSPVRIRRLCSVECAHAEDVKQSLR